MPYVVTVTRRTENPQRPVHRFPLNDEHGRPRTFADHAGAEEARAGHLATFPADEATVEETGGEGGGPAGSR